MSDLRASVAEVRLVPASADAGGLAPIYGLAASVPDRTLVSDFLKAYMDRWYVPYGGLRRRHPASSDRQCRALRRSCVLA